MLVSGTFYQDAASVVPHNLKQKLGTRTATEGLNSSSEADDAPQAIHMMLRGR